MDNKIEKKIELNAPIARVWRALTDYREFGEWFRVALEGPFVVGQTARAQIQHHDKERYSPDYAQAPRTLVEFHLEKTATGTLLVLTESGFEKVPADWRGDAFRGNDGGWTQQ